MSDNISLIPSMGISTSGLNAENRRMEVIANNIANANTSKGPDGRVFRRKEVIFAEKLSKAVGGKPGERKPGGVEVKGVVENQTAVKRIYRPGHPDADKEGYVTMPDINPVEEMVSMMSSSRAYEANLAAIKAARGMAMKALELAK